MKEKIKEVQEYFKAKIMAGDYVVTDVKKDKITLTIDGKYEFPFCIWALTLTSVMIQSNAFMTIGLTKEEKEELSSRFINVLKDAEKAEKLAQLEKLQKELGL